MQRLRKANVIGALPEGRSVFETLSEAEGDRSKPVATPKNPSRSHLGCGTILSQKLSQPLSNEQMQIKLIYHKNDNECTGAGLIGVRLLLFSAQKKEKKKKKEKEREYDRENSWARNIALLGC